ncbi:4Fe-4S binding protein [Gelria sp. Kuro-4]|uniref:4Fe-4S binding protein n=1 Tax=Gelria sp. Kuro-4 TaxID=2796927 RepID=UPI001BF0D4FA|nr:oxidoreductase [Gelria sp. Kuro-4]
MAVNLNTERCKECRYCIEACPQEALSLSENLNKMGYRVVKLDEKKCVSCGICYTVCPELVFEIK